MINDTYQVEDYEIGEGWSARAKARFRDSLYASGLTREEVEAALERELAAARGYE